MLEYTPNNIGSSFDMRGYYKASIVAVSRKYENRNIGLDETPEVQILMIAFGRPAERITRDILRYRQAQFVRNARYHANQKYPLPKTQ
jgi:hypothetical protein